MMDEPPFGEPDMRIADWINSGSCPKCEQRGFVLGPMSGVAINVACANKSCNQRYNVAIAHGRVFRAEMIEPHNDNRHHGTFS